MTKPDCWKCQGTGEHWSCLEYGCDPEGCGMQDCDCPAGLALFDE